MSKKNTDVVNEFANYGTDEKIKTKHLFFEQDVLYSYGFHFPLCIRLKDCWLVNKEGYSMTTSMHKGHLIRAISKVYNQKELEKQIKNNEITDIKLLSTEDLKEIISENFEKDKDFKFISLIDIKKLQMLKNLN